MENQIKIEKCVYCKGSGIVLEWGKHERTCNACQGTGKVYIRSFSNIQNYDEDYQNAQYSGGMYFFK
jgi:DnaJ-class molecular chaperone